MAIYSYLPIKNGGSSHSYVSLPEGRAKPTNTRPAQRRRTSWQPSHPYRRASADAHAEAHDPGDDPRNPDRPNSPTAVGAAEAIPLMGLHGMQQASMGLFDRL